MKRNTRSNTNTNNNTTAAQMPNNAGVSLTHRLALTAREQKPPVIKGGETHFVSPALARASIYPFHFSEQNAKALTQALRCFLAHRFLWIPNGKAQAGETAGRFIAANRSN